MRYRRVFAGLAVAATAASTFAVLEAAPVAAALPSQCAFDEGPAVTCTYVGQPGARFTLQLPDGVSSAHLHVVGRWGEWGRPADGSSFVNGATGGRAAVVDADVATAPGSNSFVVELRDNGGRAGSSGTGVTSLGGAGGGSTAVLLQGPSTPPTLVAEAGGGGGGGGGYRNSVLPPYPDWSPSPHSAGGDAGAAGADGGTLGSTNVLAAGAGTPGTLSGVGAGGTGAVVDTGTTHSLSFASGSAGSGTHGGDGGPGQLGGGGGGGGTRGGGGGGAGGYGQDTAALGAGGGGGSSTVPPGGSLGLALNENATVRITFALDGHAAYSTSSLDFGPVPVGTTSPAQFVTVTNNGPGPMAVGGGSISGPGVGSFDLAPGGCQASAVLDVGSSCQVGVTFRPSTTGATSATLTIQDSNETNHVVSLTGLGAVPVASISATHLAFGAAEIGSPALIRTVSLANTGNAPLVVQAATLSGDQDFTIGSDTCTGASVAPRASCSVSVRFSPRTVANHAGTLKIVHNGGPATFVALSGAGTPPADLKIRGVGSVYTGRDHLVTGVVPGAGSLQTYALAVVNEDSVARSYRINLVSSGSASTAEVWSTGIGARKLPSDGAGTFTTGSVQPGRSVTYSLRVTPAGAGQLSSGAKVTLQTDFGAGIESVTTETNTAAPANGTSAFELFARQGSQAFIGGPRDNQTTTGPALNVGGSALYTVRLRNNGAAAARVGLRLTDVDACAGAFSVTATAARQVRTGDAYAGRYLTPLLTPGGYQDVQVSIRRVAAGCGERLIRAQSLDNGTVVRTSYLLANAAYNAATD